ncbi:P-type conjugative transfer protein TrbG [Azospirillum sp. RWY-5-1]|uniref:P-type conjugative transfer protein TrbG n=1 Tax=Azospirillum oleiclasticum TaxID=2735135 RepID=A0ABX2TIW7_9PROT|nr:P-type conjugative transfer protein TrbG [Azospirillum oleiclasticum]NYZ23271.1 P-type conjugative transfer protein TrbG [Azospirillum oleiclasticum]
MVFAYGATLPSVVCAPLRACSLRLDPGETIAQIDPGDPVRWKVTPTVFGSGAAATSAVVVKPSDSGLTTSMTVATDRRLYVVPLVSRTKDWIPVVAFAYPEDEHAAWKAYRAAPGREAEAADGLSGLDPADLDFGFRVSVDRPSWRPLRVYTDGVRTYVQVPPAMRHDEAPALVAIGSDAREQLVNYRLTGERFVVDTVLRHAALVRFEFGGAVAGRWYARSRRGALSAGSPFTVREALPE